MKLTFMKGQKVETELATTSSREEAEKIIHKFLDDHEFKSYYFKLSIFPSKTVYDVGSWTDFFVLYNSDDVELNTVPLWEDVA